MEYHLFVEEAAIPPSTVDSHIDIYAILWGTVGLQVHFFWGVGRFTVGCCERGKLERATPQSLQIIAYVCLDFSFYNVKIKYFYVTHFE